ncbi:amidase [Caballeronia sp. LZ065]|uniref:amidase n=1 Tax=Caballeronia sp. LZ065 TaxID=3038571 RepID=UPI00285E5353|nr:amidase [Caballeronia sp. LZ065]MDR5784732.1 amidase [Caballeronia sp. LZ065]
MNDELAFLSATDLAEAYRRKHLSPVEVTRAALTRIEQLNPRINAIYWLAADEALDAARASEERWRRGAPLGLLDGIPTTVKDALPVAGMPGYRGSACTPDGGIAAPFDAPAVARLRESGVILLGKNTMCDYGIIAGSVSSRFGVTRNPWNLSRSAGASSSGAAAAVAAGLHPLALGTDIVGSIRLPASFCGLVGLKPSYGRVPYYPPVSPALVAGPMARNVADVALMLDCIARPDPRDFTALPPAGQSYHEASKQPLDNVRIHLVTDLGFGLSPDAEVVEAVRAGARRLEQAGIASIEERPARFAHERVEAAERFYRARCFAELNKHAPERQPLSPLLYEWTRASAGESAESVIDAMQALLALREQAMALLDDADFLILPATPAAAFAAERAAPDETRLFDPWCNTFLFNLTEQPAISVPCGKTLDGLPIGMQIVGRRYDDLGVLRLARLFEDLTGPFEACPEL